MAKSKATDQPAVGTRIRVKPGIMAPEFPDVSCEGWTGTINETIGKKADPKFVIEWDAATLQSMPEAYRQECEQRGLYYQMACLPASDFDVVS